MTGFTVRKLGVGLPSEGRFCIEFLATNPPKQVTIVEIVDGVSVPRARVEGDDMELAKRLVAILNPRIQVLDP